MKLFSCGACQHVVHFENSQCTNCGHALAFLPDRSLMTAIDPVADVQGIFTALAPGADRARYKLCGNQLDHNACNWAVPEKDENRFCRDCRLNEVIPNLSSTKAKDAWLKLEQAKRRMVYTLLELGLPVDPLKENPKGLAFAMKEDQPSEKVMIGHDSGLITINIAEADSPFREKMQLELGETYRTLLGHFRHEIGHYYLDRLIGGSPFIEGFRALFGDERASYEQALQNHYQNGAPRDWPLRFVSSYASMHPWEDWAESWAHYLHMVDTIETAHSFGLDLRPQSVGGRADSPLRERALEAHTSALNFDDFDDLVGAWVPLSIALNALNRSMGVHDAYPFVLSEPAVEKLRFVHQVIEQAPEAS